MTISTVKLDTPAPKRPKGMSDEDWSYRLQDHELERAAILAGAARSVMVGGQAVLAVDEKGEPPYGVRVSFGTVPPTITRLPDHEYDQLRPAELTPEPAEEPAVEEAPGE